MPNELPAGLAALFAKKPGATAGVSKPPPPSPSRADFFARLVKKPEPGPEATPGIQDAPAPKAGPFDVMKEATKSLDRTGYFDRDPNATPVEVPSTPMYQAEVSSPKGLFKGIGSAPVRDGKRKPKIPKEGKVAVSLAALFKLDKEPEINPNCKIGKAQRREGVKDSHELQRIMKIARRDLVIEKANDLTEEFRKPGGTMGLWPIQSWILHEARLNDGALGMLGVGQGKTLSSLLLGAALCARMTVILVPPALRAQLINIDIPLLSRHWKIPLAKIRIVAYSQLSNASSADILEEHKPDLIVADEAHSLRYRTATRTKRFLRYMKDHPECRFVPLSGTFTRRSLHDYQHLSELALKKNSPLPNHFPTLAEWAEAIDVSDDPMPPGALMGLCSDEELADAAALDTEADEYPEQLQEIIRKAFRRRLVDTPGVVATEESAIGTSLIINAVRPTVPPEVLQELTKVRNLWKIQDEELIDALAVARVARQLAAGFYYRWKWPEGKPDVEWLDARKEWNREVREILRLSRKGLDSPMLIAKACERGEYESAAYERWAAVKDRPEPPREAIWISDFLVQYAMEWAKKNASKKTPAIIWYTHTVVGELLAKKSGFPFFGPGTAASVALTQVDPKKTPVIICSQKAHGTGKNLQAFCLNLFLTPMPGGVEWEQTTARTHRPGQLADEVSADVCVHTSETLSAFRNAVRDAGYIQQSTGQRQKILFAHKLGFEERAFEFTGREAPNLEVEGLTWEGPASIEDIFARAAKMHGKE